MVINNEIIEGKTGFDNSKLLKEIGFNCACNENYELALKSRKNKEHGYSGSFGWKKGELNIQNEYNRNTTLDHYYDNKNWYGCSMDSCGHDCGCFKMKTTKDLSGNTVLCGNWIK
jgi:hypothetical protein